MKQLSEFIQARPRLITAFFLVIVLAALYPALRIRTDFNLERFFPREDPTIEDYRVLEQEFGRDDNILMVGFQSDSLLQPAVLRDLKAMVDSAGRIRHVSDVRSLWSAEQIESDGTNLQFDPYLEEGSLNAAGKLRDALTGNPFVRGLFLNKAADVTAFYLEIDKDRNNFEVRDRIIGRLNEILDPYRHRYDFNITGIPYYRNQYVHFLNDEIIFYITLSSLLIVVILWFLYRSVIGLTIPMLIVWFTILLTLAVMQLTGGYFEVMSSTIAPILLCVGIADSIHMISKYDEARQQSLPKPQSIREMLLTLGNATFLTSITTAIGFATLVTSDIIPMQRFGVYTAGGVMIAFILTIFLLPAALSITNIPRIFKHRDSRVFSFFNRLLERINKVNRSSYRTVILAFTVATLVIGSGISLVKVNGKVFDELGRDTAPIHQARFFSDHLAPPYPMEIIIDTGEENGISDPDFIRRLDALTHYLDAREEVNRTVSLDDLLSEIHRAMAPGQYREHPLPRNRKLAAQYLLLLEINDSDALQRMAGFDYRRIRVSCRTYDVGSHRINRFQRELNQYLDAHFPDSHTIITGSTILSANLNEKMVSSLFKSILLAFFLISVIMAIMFRSPLMVVISLVPNLLPLLFIAGFMGFSGINIKAATAVIFTIAFGIAVDDSIHYLARFRVEMKRGRTMNEALGVTTRKTGKAIIVTSIVLLAGFGSLLTSVFISTVHMGLLISLTIVAALLADLFLLPSLFYWLKPTVKIRSESGTPPARPAGESDPGRDSRR